MGSLPVNVLRNSLASALQRVYPESVGWAAIAVDIAKILARAVDMAIASGRASDPNVWARALTAAASEFESEELAKNWLSLERIG